jgi:RNA polymerase sigma-70 factor, ECF subfamily
MVRVNRTLHEAPVSAAGPDPVSAEWLRALADTGPRREAALARLHELLVRIARGEVRRRAPRLGIAGPELEDLAYQAAADALLAITGKIGQFRGGEPVHHLGLQVRHLRGVGQDRTALLAAPGRAAGRRGLGPAAGPVRLRPPQEAECRDLLAALRRALDTELTPRQRAVFVAIVLNDVPLDALVIELASSRNAIYKVLFDARRKLRAAPAADGYIGDDCLRSP